MNEPVFTLAGSPPFRRFADPAVGPPSRAEPAERPAPPAAPPRPAPA